MIWVVFGIIWLFVAVFMFVYVTNFRQIVHKTDNPTRLERKKGAKNG